MFIKTFILGSMVIGGLMNMLGMVEYEDTTPEDIQPTVVIEEKVEEKEQVKEVEKNTLMELDTSKEYVKINNRNDLKECLEGENIELKGRVWGIEENGSMGVKFQLEIDDRDGYAVEINAPKEYLNDLKKDDVITVQGVFRGVQSWSMNKEGENVGAYQINSMNIYK